MTFTDKLPLALLAAMPFSASAAVTVNFAQVGSDVVATASGSFSSLVGLELIDTVNQSTELAYVFSAEAYLGLGPGFGVTGQTSTRYSGVLPPLNLGSESGNGFLATSTTGSFLFVLGDGILILPDNFQLSTVFNQTATWTNTSLVALSLSPGSYIYSWTGDSVTVNVQGTPIPEPSTYGLALGVLALAGAAIRRRSCPRS